MALTRYTKHPGAKRGYPINVVNLGANTVTSASGASTPAGLTLVVTNTSTSVLATISGGTAGILYQPEITINLSNGEILVHEFEIMVVDN